MNFQPPTNNDDKIAQVDALLRQPVEMERPQLGLDTRIRAAARDLKVERNTFNRSTQSRSTPNRPTLRMAASVAVLAASIAAVLAATIGRSILDKGDSLIRQEVVLQEVPETVSPPSELPSLAASDAVAPSRVPHVRLLASIHNPLYTETMNIASDARRAGYYLLKVTPCLSHSSERQASDL